MPRYLIGKYNLVSNMDDIPLTDYPLDVREKFDGCFALWDGGFSTGVFKSMIPWANRWKDKRDFVCTGLWSKDGNVIHAPRWFLDALPKGRGLYMELWAGVGNFQKTVSIIKKHVPKDDEWNLIVGKIFNDDVPLNKVFARGSIKYNKGSAHIEDAPPIGGPVGTPFVPSVPFLQVVNVVTCCDPSDLSARICRLPPGSEGVVCISHKEPFSLMEYDHAWKIKDCLEADGIVTGYYAGDKRLIGRLGALRVAIKGTTISFSLGGGLADRERVLNEPCHNYTPGELLPPHFKSRVFPIGTTIQFAYRKLSDAGQPIEARFERIKE